jgi:hypothetical protein
MKLVLQMGLSLEFEGLTAPVRVELLDAQTYDTGAALHAYRPEGSTS